MNTISFSTVNVSNSSNVSLRQNPVFTATPKTNQIKKGAKDVKQSINFIQRLYKALFIPSKESVVKMENGNVYTESSKSGIITSKKYGMWKSTPSEIIEHNEIIGISHCDCEADAEFVAEEIRRRFGFERIMIQMMEPAIGAHTGPGTIGLFFRGNKR